RRTSLCFCATRSARWSRRRLAPHVQAKPVDPGAEHKRHRSRVDRRGQTPWHGVALGCQLHEAWPDARPICGLPLRQGHAHRKHFYIFVFPARFCLRDRSKGHSSKIKIVKMQLKFP
ncbi:unnamed protein product, partial [Ixodes pacificus]